jgi:spore germination cell wall hydrolase CwlJ-like protein
MSIFLGLLALTTAVSDPAPAPAATTTPTAGVTSIAAARPVRAFAQTDPSAMLERLIEAHAQLETADAEQDCLANTIYFEAGNEPLEGQVAVAEVVLNRMNSGRYPGTICGVVLQPAQFSYVRGGRIPRVDRTSEDWRRAVGIARMVQANATARLLPTDTLWYHADYVSPAWGPRLNRTTKIGLHIFYR